MIMKPGSFPARGLRGHAPLGRPSQLRLRRARRRPSAPATIKVMNGAAAGREVALTKVVTTVGKPGVQVASITKRPGGYVFAHVEGASRPTVNGNPLVGETGAAEERRRDRARRHADAVRAGLSGCLPLPRADSAGVQALRAPLSFRRAGIRPPRVTLFTHVRRLAAGRRRASECDFGALRGAPQGHHASIAILPGRVRRCSDTGAHLDATAQRLRRSPYP